MPAITLPRKRISATSQSQTMTFSAKNMALTRALQKAMEKSVGCKFRDCKECENLLSSLIKHASLPHIDRSSDSVQLQIPVAKAKRAKPDELVLDCTICKQSFKSKKILSQHLRYHAKNKYAVKCDICEKLIVHKAALNEHQRIHTDDKPFKCDICLKRFRQKHHLTNHIRIHSDQKPFQCVLCNKWFRQTSTLKSHIQTHIRERPWECLSCHKTFSTSNTLRHHEKTHKTRSAGQRSKKLKPSLFPQSQLPFATPPVSPTLEPENPIFISEDEPPPSEPCNSKEGSNAHGKLLNVTYLVMNAENNAVDSVPDVTPASVPPPPPSNLQSSDGLTETRDKRSIFVPETLPNSSLPSSSSVGPSRIPESTVVSLPSFGNEMMLTCDLPRQDYEHPSESESSLHIAIPPPFHLLERRFILSRNDSSFLVVPETVLESFVTSTSSASPHLIPESSASANHLTPSKSINF